ncbi:MAG: hypothetical protein RDV48_23750 [Candidatus Eremiobacteraeota bacterium]|nr:hypothetical protein [Candidatus Eremiobacteraeota bacterium]
MRKGAALILIIACLLGLPFMIASCGGSRGPMYATSLPDPPTKDSTHAVNVYNDAYTHRQPIMMVFSPRKSG